MNATACALAAQLPSANQTSPAVVNCDRAQLRSFLDACVRAGLTPTMLAAASYLYQASDPRSGLVDGFYGRQTELARRSGISTATFRRAEALLVRSALAAREWRQLNPYRRARALRLSLAAVVARKLRLVPGTGGPPVSTPPERELFPPAERLEPEIYGPGEVPVELDETGVESSPTAGRCELSSIAQREPFAIGQRERCSEPRKMNTQRRRTDGAQRCAQPGPRIELPSTLETMIRRTRALLVSTRRSLPIRSYGAGMFAARPPSRAL